MGNPNYRQGMSSGFVSIAVHPDVHQAVRELAARERSSMTNVVRQAIELYREHIEQAATLK
jgi:hypothetical protein